ncbi:toll/interleukin-1 receptor domain-containing protein [Sedimentitalea nanhaiensis]|uniref:TIR domain-containing protein n=1 Tax=Sedimentitalea nanhaiensis TaxID=999627 RepID=A0A1I7E4N3_9RHOB|nr:toll/interleukin-1 receptor domain-containing protein [Sedimentitalea nanhaiensis]SFU18875.1 TIR domain-containing protein [Sedimentitalea nanhaiensis]
MPSKVFISHKNTDAALAEKVARRVRVNGLETYLDTIDDALVKDGPDLADLLLSRMGQCQQLIAVVSSQTKDSWWVPWEIGVGSEKGFRMASYSETHVSLPSYLEKWPALHTDRHIDLYCEYSKQTEVALNRRMRDVLTEDRRMQVRKSEALDFHKQLRAAIR